MFDLVLKTKSLVFIHTSQTILGYEYPNDNQTSGQGPLFLLPPPMNEAEGRCFIANRALGNVMQITKNVSKVPVNQVGATPDNQKEWQEWQ